MSIEVENLRSEISQLKNLLQIKNSQIDSLDLHVQKLEERIRLHLLARFGKSSEEYRSHNQPGFFDEIESDADSSEDPAKNDTVEVSYTRKKRGHRKPIPEFLLREDIEHDLTAEDKKCSQHNQEMDRIGEDVSEQLDITPAKIKVLRHIRPKYKCSCCEGSIKQQLMPPQPIPGSMAAPSLLAYICVSKYVDHLPLYRLENKFQRIHVDLPRSTMARWMIKVSELVTPLYNLLEEKLLEGGFIQMDETTVQVLKEKNRDASTKSYMWVRGRDDSTGPPIILYDYFPSRSSKVVENLLGDYSGMLQTDGYPAYDSFCRGREVVHIGCFAHTRRKFWEAYKAAKKSKGTLAEQGLEYFKKIYIEEKLIKESPIEERAELRQKNIAPILSELRHWLDKSINLAPSTLKTGEAMQYLHDQWPKLIRVLDDGRIPLDTNYLESKIRPFTIGRKNWTFSDTPKGAHASAMIYSLIETAKANKVDPFEYLSLVLKRIPSAETADDFEMLLPFNIIPDTVH